MHPNLRLTIATLAELGVATAGAITGDPLIAAGAATAAPAVVESAEVVIERRLALRRSKQERVIEAAAKGQGITIDELVGQVDTQAKRDLLSVTLEAAAGAEVLDKLVAVALALGDGAAGTDEDAAWQAEFVRTVGMLDQPRLELLLRFSLEPDDLGLNVADDAYLGSTPVELRHDQVLRIAADLPVVPALLADLQRCGLVLTTHAGGGTFGGGGGTTRLQITSFGLDVLRRLDEIGEAVSAWIK